MRSMLGRRPSAGQEFRQRLHHQLSLRRLHSLLHVFDSVIGPNGHPYLGDDGAGVVVLFHEVGPSRRFRPRRPRPRLDARCGHRSRVRRTWAARLGVRSECGGGRRLGSAAPVSSCSRPAAPNPLPPPAARRRWRRPSGLGPDGCGLLRWRVLRPAAAARRKAKLPPLLLITTATWAPRASAAQASITACRTEPPCDAKTAMRPWPTFLRPSRETLRRGCGGTANA